jgi:hypothetical protein
VCLADVAETMPDVTEEYSNILVCEKLSPAEFLGVVVVDGPHQAYRRPGRGERCEHEEPGIAGELSAYFVRGM